MMESIPDQVDHSDTELEEGSPNTVKQVSF